MGSGRGPKSPLPHIKALCPITNMVFGSKVVDPHFCIATLCKNGTVHIYCTLHAFKGFINHPVILEALLGDGKEAKAV
jgi:hypothetical protein